MSELLRGPPKHAQRLHHISLRWELPSGVGNLLPTAGAPPSDPAHLAKNISDGILPDFQSNLSRTGR